MTQPDNGLGIFRCGRDSKKIVTDYKPGSPSIGVAIVPGKGDDYCYFI